MYAIKLSKFEFKEKILKDDKKISKWVNQKNKKVN